MVIIVEGSPSGLWRLLGKQVWQQCHRGFESHTFRLRFAEANLRRGAVRQRRAKAKLRTTAGMWGFISENVPATIKTSLKKKLLLLSQSPHSLFVNASGDILTKSGSGTAHPSKR